jgi:transposase-like protein
VPRTRPPYPPEFRREAIRLVRASGEEHPVPRIANELGVSVETLCATGSSRRRSKRASARG